MKTTPEHNLLMAKTIFATVYPYYIKKVESKGRTIEELHEIIKWLTGFDKIELQNLIEKKVTYQEFFATAVLNTKAHLIKGVICGYKVEEIINPLTQKVRYLDKLIDELAKGKQLDKILRVA